VDLQTSIFKLKLKRQLRASGYADTALCCGGLIPGRRPKSILSIVLAAVRHYAHCDAYARGIVEENACRVRTCYIMSMYGYIRVAARRGMHQNGLRYPKQCKYSRVMMHDDDQRESPERG